jgi:hypothetical protein
MSEEIATADANLAYIARLTAERDALLLRCDLLNQAAHEYSESRDRWLLHAREAQRQNATLRKLLGRVRAYLTSRPAETPATRALVTAIDAIDAAGEIKIPGDS